MTFNIGDTAVSKNLTIEQLTAGLDKVKDSKKIKRITQIFNQYNTNTNGNSATTLDLDEQVALMNDLHRADSNGKGEKFDGKISGRGLKKAELTGKYKAYKDFIEAYQKAVASDVNTYELTFKDATLDGTPFVETTAVQTGETVTVEHKYNNISGKTELSRTVITNEDGSFCTDPKGRLLRQTIGGVTIQYCGYTSDAKNAQAGIIVVNEQDSGERMTLKLQDDGTYLNEADQTHFRLDRLGIPNNFTVDDKNRITAEFWGDNLFDYTYEGEDTKPSSVTLNKGDEDEITFTREGELYTSMNNEVKEYYIFDTENRIFTQIEAPQPKQKEVEKPQRPTSRHYIKMTAGWKNQRVNPDETLIAQFNAMLQADEVLTELINRNEQLKDKNLNREQLLADLIKNNPSVFDKDGIIYSNAKWDKLDFPQNLSSYIQNN